MSTASATVQRIQATLQSIPPPLFKSEFDTAINKPENSPVRDPQPFGKVFEFSACDQRFEETELRQQLAEITISRNALREINTTLRKENEELKETAHLLYEAKIENTALMRLNGLLRRENDSLATSIELEAKLERAKKEIGVWKNLYLNGVSKSS